MLSRAAKNERTALEDLKEAARLLSRASGKFRADSTGTIMSGMLSGATLIVNDVHDIVNQRTTE